MKMQGSSMKKTVKYFKTWQDSIKPSTGPCWALCNYTGHMPMKQPRVEMFYLFLVVVVTQCYVFVKAHRTMH